MNNKTVIYFQFYFFQLNFFLAREKKNEKRHISNSMMWGSGVTFFVNLYIRLLKNLFEVERISCFSWTIFIVPKQTYEHLHYIYIYVCVCVCSWAAVFYLSMFE